MSKLSALGHVGLAFETTYGTAVAPEIYVPYTSIKVEDDIKKITDEGRRGSLSKEFGVYNATREGKVDLSMDAYPETLGYFLKAILGQDTVVGAATPYTHTFKVVNALAPTMTISDYNAITERQYAGAVLSELDFKFDTENVMTVDAKFASMASVVGTTTTPTFSVGNPFLGYQTTLKVGGTANTNLVGGNFKIKRETKLIYGANNTQDPTKYSAGRIDVSGKLTFDIEDETELTLFLNGTQPTIDLVFTIDANTLLEVSFGKVDLSKAVVDRSQEFLRVDIDFKALYNTTDAGMTTITLKNSVATY